MGLSLYLHLKFWENAKIQFQYFLIKAKIDKTQQNSKCRWCGDRDETINQMKCECSKLAQKEYTTRHDKVGNVFLWESCKKSNFNDTNKYMHKPESVLENEADKVLLNFETTRPQHCF